MEFHFESMLLQTFALLFTAFLLPRFQINGPVSGLLMIVALAFVNSHLWDAALFYSIPNSFSTQAGVTLLVNGVVFWLLAKSLPGVEIQGFLPALVGPILFTIVSLLTNQYGQHIDWKEVTRWIEGVFSFLRDFVKKGAAPHTL